MDNTVIDRAVEDFLEVALDGQIKVCRDKSCKHCSDGWVYSHGAVEPDNPHRELCDCVIFGDMVEKIVMHKACASCGDPEAIYGGIEDDEYMFCEECYEPRYNVNADFYEFLAGLNG